MRSRPAYSCGLLFILINIVVVSCFSNRRAAQIGFQIDPTASIRIDTLTKRKYQNDLRCLNALLKELRTDKDFVFQQSAFNAFFGSLTTKLVLSEKKLPSYKGGISGHGAGFDTNWNFRDTILLNSLDFETGSREYLISVIIHETIHDYITWCSMSFRFKKNGVDAEYIKQHFSMHAEWLKRDSLYPSEEEEHILMSENFAGIMVQSLYPYVNGPSDSTLRRKIAISLTWVGLSATPAFNNQLLDPCYMYSVDTWARHMDATEDIKAGAGKCDSTDFGFFRALHLTPVCKTHSL